MRIRLAAALAVSCAAGILAAPSRAATPPTPPCVRFAVSPAFHVDRTAYCLTWTAKPVHEKGVLGGPEDDVYHYGTTDIAVHRTDDGGRSWKRLESDLPYDRDTAPGDVTVSADYATDHLVAVHLSNLGLYVSKDRGETFTVADPLAQSVPRAVGTNMRSAGRVGSFVAAPAAAGAPRPAATFTFFDPSISMGESDPNQPPATGHGGWSGNSALVPSAGGHVPVRGGPGLSSAGFQLSATFGRGGRGYLLTSNVAPTGTVRYALWACDETLDCSTPVRVLSDNWGAELTILDRAGGDLGLVLREPVTRGTSGADYYRTHVWRSSDAGVTWRTWTAAENVMRPFNALADRRRDSSVVPYVKLAADPLRTGRIVLRTSLADAGEAAAERSPHAAADPPGEQIWLSTDRGARFTRTAAGPSAGQAGRGGVPWNSRFTGNVYAGHDGPDSLFVASDGRIFVVAAVQHGGRLVRAGVYCSVDGRRWQPTC